MLGDGVFSHAFLAMLLGTSWVAALLMAGAVVRWRRAAIERAEANGASGRGLAAEFREFVEDRSDGAWLRRLASRASRDAFWEALERFTQSASERQWSKLSSQLSHAKVVADEQARLFRGPAWRRALAARRLGLIDVPWVRAPLRTAMMRGPETVTLAAGFGLARCHDAPALEWLLANPRATARTSRRMLVTLLGEFGRACDPVLLRSVAARPGALPIHVAAIEALAQSGVPHVRVVVEEILLRGELESRVASARTLGRLRHAESIRALSGALNDPAWEVRCQAALALGYVGSANSIPRLMEAAEDPAWWVRRHATQALGMLGEPGRVALVGITARSGDRYARDIAEETLQMLEWEHERAQGQRRVA